MSELSLASLTTLSSVWLQIVGVSTESLDGTIAWALSSDFRSTSTLALKLCRRVRASGLRYTEYKELKEQADYQVRVKGTHSFSTLIISVIEFIWSLILSWWSLSAVVFQITWTLLRISRPVALPCP